MGAVTFGRYPEVERPLTELLRVKRALAKILHASGAAHFIMQAIRNIDEGAAMADGSTDLRALFAIALVSKPGVIIVR